MARMMGQIRYPSTVLLRSLGRVAGEKPPECTPVGPSGPAITEPWTNQTPEFAGPRRKTMENQHVRHLHEGDHVTATEHGGIRITGRIEATVPHMDAAWIREDGLGARHLITLQDILEDPTAPTSETGDSPA